MSTLFFPPQTTQRDNLRDAMTRCRQATLRQFDGVDDATYRAQAHPDFSPMGWHLGHIGFTEELWLLRHLAGAKPLQPQYHQLYAADGLPKTERVNLPSFQETCQYLQQVREKVFAYLDVAPLADQARLWWFLLQHESQHGETIAIVHRLQTRQPSPVLDCSSPPPFDSIEIPGGCFEMGSHAIDALDNERPQHTVEVSSYRIDRYPVTCGQYRQFIEAGGYDNSRYWTKAGWQWLQRQTVRQPLHWSDNRGFDNHPVSGVSWYEASAYAQFAGKRLPTEAEWEKAARWNSQTQLSQRFSWGEDLPEAHHCNHNGDRGGTTPVHAYADNVSPVGCADMMGNVWEWTTTPFEGYEGFEFFPYKGYSQAYFDGEHYVLRGGSWATRPWGLRGAFRNWYHPHVREIFAGFRLCEG